MFLLIWSSNWTGCLHFIWQLYMQTVLNTISIILKMSSFPGIHRAGATSAYGAWAGNVSVCTGWWVGGMVVELSLKLKSRCSPTPDFQIQSFVISLNVLNKTLKGKASQHAHSTWRSESGFFLKPRLGWITKLALVAPDHMFRPPLPPSLSTCPLCISALQMGSSVPFFQIQYIYTHTHIYMQ